MTWNSIVFWVKVTSGQFKFVQAVVIGLDEDDEDDHVLAKVCSRQ